MGFRITKRLYDDIYECGYLGFLSIEEEKVEEDKWSTTVKTYYCLEPSGINSSFIETLLQCGIVLPKYLHDEEALFEPQ